MVTDKTGEKYVWYVAYGSNMCKKRFMTYIKGGKCEFNGKFYNGCSDKTPPKSIKRIDLPFDMFYGNESGSWEGSATCFLDVSKPGFSFGRAYLIKESQLFEIQNSEGYRDNWYGNKILLGKIGFFEAYTLTCALDSETFENRKSFSDVKDKYVNVLTQGLN